MALGRAMKEFCGMRNPIKKNSAENTVAVKGKAIKTYATEKVQDGAKPNYHQGKIESDGTSRASAKGKIKLDMI